jgi:hypothetical protein
MVIPSYHRGKATAVLPLSVTTRLPWSNGGQTTMVRPSSYRGKATVVLPLSVTPRLPWSNGGHKPWSDRRPIEVRLLRFYHGLVLSSYHGQRVVKQPWSDRRYIKVRPSLATNSLPRYQTWSQRRYRRQCYGTSTMVQIIFMN